MRWVVNDLKKIGRDHRQCLRRHTPSWHDALDFMREACMVADTRKDGSYIAITLYKRYELIGWALLDFYLSGRSKGVRTYVYVRPMHRRCGYGTQILEKAKAKAKRMGRTIRVCPHDNRSTKFFKACKVMKSEVVPGYVFP